MSQDLDQTFERLLAARDAVGAEGDFFREQRQQVAKAGPRLATERDAVGESGPALARLSLS